jgi:hypothetical protein
MPTDRPQCGSFFFIMGRNYRIHDHDGLEHGVFLRYLLVSDCADEYEFVNAKR